jgi:LAO/AO transport system kinase
MKMKLADKILAGNVLAAARLMTEIEDGVPEAVAELETIYPHTGNAYIVGVTGPPGVGKSTLVDTLTGILRRDNMTVGVLAIDPTSPFTGGAILGDRVRMQKHSLDKGVFIRSLASRGWGGGLSKATISMIHIMDAMSKDIILVETMGAGQAEIDITRVADTSIVILSPGMGDEIQMMKAGILEAADILVINKADREGAENLKRQLEIMLEIKAYLPNEWQPSIVLTEAIHDKGTEELVAAILKHREFLISSGGLEKRRKQRAKLELIEATESSLKDYIYQQISKDDYFEKLVDDLVKRRTNPHSAASKIINQFKSVIGQVGKQSKPR